MRIRRLEVEGFRSLKKISWEPGALNVVIGPNGSGKSNLLQVLWLLQKAAKGELYRNLKSLGGPISIAWDGAVDCILFATDMIGDLSKKEHYASSWLMQIDIDKTTNSYSIHREFVKKETKENTGLSTLCRSRKATIDSGHLYFDDRRSEEIESMIYNYPLGTGSHFIKHISRFIDSNSVYSYFDTTPQSSIRQAAVTAYEKILAPDGSNLIQVLHTLYTSDRNFEEDVDSAMRAAFGDEYVKLVFPPAADQRVQLRIRWKSLKREQSALDISDGTLRFLYLLAILANPDPSPLIAIDEPETGLHPSMFRIIAEFAQECSKKSQVIFTTHSPQFLDAFGDTPPTTTVAQWRNGETELKVLDGEELAVWLREYSLGQLFTSGELEGMA